MPDPEADQPCTRLRSRVDRSRTVHPGHQFLPRALHLPSSSDYQQQSYSISIATSGRVRPSRLVHRHFAPAFVLSALRMGESSFHARPTHNRDTLDGKHGHS